LISNGTALTGVLMDENHEAQRLSAGAVRASRLD
jgi:hypothetical protein